MNNNEIKFSVLTQEQNNTCIAQFFYDDSLPYGRFQNSVAKNFNLDLSKLEKQTNAERDEYVASVVNQLYDSALNELVEAKDNLEFEFNKVKEDIFKILYEIFGVTLPKGSTIFANIGLNFVCPRYLDTFTFDLNYKKEMHAKIQTCIHEIIHFYYFEKWKQVFPDYKRREFDAPNLVWLLSEIFIDAAFTCTPLKKYNSKDCPSYEYLYEETFNGQNLMEIFREIFKNNTIENYMKKSIEFIYENEDYFKTLAN